ncbi:flavin reductase [Nocardioides gansuensis]|uniref:Flavin reductase n=1 Tax=Nocardioides gansuensis TaxID=2138300 RepID=A0A2T8FD33_9ACTN|nr:flavin reductase [Nocardioides gansuensis]PVG83613.1 flavin reductase [Nocardioides gansuensis]
MTQHNSPGASAQNFTPADFRRVLGQYPTGVVVVSATQPDGPPIAMTIGSFTSVSLDPPLVAFYPDKTSTSWPRIEQRGAFCVSVLGADQESLCRNFAMKSDDKFRHVSWRLSGTGSPIINGAVAWIDCRIESVQEAGDHYLVLARVEDLAIDSGSLPLLFFRGGYGRFTPLSLATGDLTMMSHLRGIDQIRDEMTSLAEKLRVEVLAGARIADEFVLLAGAAPERAGAELSRVGRRMPFVAPLGAPIAAWTPDLQESGWFGGSAPHDSIVAEEWLETLDHIRTEGYFVGFGDSAYAGVEQSLQRVDGTMLPPDAELHDAVAHLRQSAWAPSDVDATAEYEVRSMSAPVFTRDGTVLQFSLYGFPATITGAVLRRTGAELVEAASRATARLGGRMPSTAGPAAEAR